MKSLNIFWDTSFYQISNITDLFMLMALINCFLSHIQKFADAPDTEGLFQANAKI